MIMTNLSDFARDITSFWSPSQLMIVAASAAMILWIVQGYWNRRKLGTFLEIPGPPGLPLIGSAYLFIGSLTRVFKTLIRIFDEHSGICRFGVGHINFVGISDPEMLEVVLNNQNTLEKGLIYRYFKEGVGDGIATAPVPLWKKNRKMISPAFNQKILDGFVQTFNENGKYLNERIKTESSNEYIDLEHHLHEVSLNTLFETSCGVKLSEKRILSTSNRLIERFCEIMFLRLFCLPLQPEFMFWLFGYRKEINEIMENCHKITDKIISDKVNEQKKEEEELENQPGIFRGEDHSPSKRKVFLDRLIELVYKEEKMSKKQMKDEFITFLMAGSDTTAETLGFTFTCLGLYHNLQQKVYMEIRSEIGQENDVQSTDYSKLKYTERFLKEVLRMFPIAPVLGRTAITDIQLGPYKIPAGIPLLLSVYNIHHNAQYWPNPKNFDPDRFLPEEVAKRNPYTFVPFSAGPRNCIGIRYAMMQMKTMVVSVLREFEVFTHYKSIEDVKVEANITLRPVKGFGVYFKPRHPNSLS